MLNTSIMPGLFVNLTEVSNGTVPGVPSKNLFPSPCNPYLKTDCTSLLTFFLVKNFEEKEI